MFYVTCEINFATVFRSVKSLSKTTTLPSLGALKSACVTAFTASNNDLYDFSLSVLFVLMHWSKLYEKLLNWTPILFIDQLRAQLI